MRKNKLKKTNERINNFLEMPREISANEPKLTVQGFKELLIENFKGILEYEDFFVRINTSIGTININGFNLNLKQITDEDIMISGKIDNIELEAISSEEETNAN